MVEYFSNEWFYNCMAIYGQELQWLKIMLILLSMTICCSEITTTGI